MEPNRHIIMQQTLDVALSGSESDGMALHRRLPDLCAQRIVPAIELVLNRYTPRNGFLTIDRLEIDAGSVSLGNLERELPRLVAQALEKVLQDMPYTDRLGRAAMTDNIRHKTEPESITEAFLFFLENGTLPWSFSAGSATELESIIQKAWREAEKTGSSIRNIKMALLETLRSPTARARLIRQFTPAFLETMLGILSSEGKKISIDIREIFERADIPKNQIKRLETLMWEQVFLRVASGKALTEALLIKEIKSRLTVSDLHEGKLETLLARYWPDDLERVAGDVSSSGQSEEMREIKPYQAKEQQEAGGKSVPEKQRDQQEIGETPGKTADVPVSSSGKSDKAPHADASNIITDSSKSLGHAHPDKETG
ncbi:MAG: hypothetical protein HGB19_13920, partial [Chlorobiales bacterium]|nr:hypothetical protein [Chlorobiales bacterium]